MNEKVGVVYQQLLKTANRKQQNTDNVHLLIESCDIKLEILNKLAHFNQLETQITAMSELFFSEGFSIGHVIIATIISDVHLLHLSSFRPSWFTFCLYFGLCFEVPLYFCLQTAASKSCKIAKQIK